MASCGDKNKCRLWFHAKLCLSGFIITPNPFKRWYNALSIDSLAKHSCSVLYHMMTHPDHSERLQTNISPLVLLVWVKVSAWKIIGQHKKLCIGFCQINKGHSEGDIPKVNLDIYQSSLPEFLLLVLKNSAAVLNESSLSQHQAPEKIRIIQDFSACLSCFQWIQFPFILHNVCLLYILF